METLERFEVNQRVIEDVTRRTLAAISTDYGRLVYLASLRDLATGRYAHDGLEALYPAAAVQDGLAYCHEEIFARILEAPLEQQEWDLRAFLATLEGDFWESVTAWRELEPFRSFVPRGVPSYLRELFISNLRVLLELFVADRATWQEAA